MSGAVIARDDGEAGGGARSPSSLRGGPLTTDADDPCGAPRETVARGAGGSLPRADFSWPRVQEKSRRRSRSPLVRSPPRRRVGAVAVVVRNAAAAVVVVALAAACARGGAPAADPTAVVDAPVVVTLQGDAAGGPWRARVVAKDARDSGAVVALVAALDAAAAKAAGPVVDAVHDALVAAGRADFAVEHAGAVRTRGVDAAGAPWTGGPR